MAEILPPPTTPDTDIYREPFLLQTVDLPDLGIPIDQAQIDTALSALTETAHDVDTVNTRLNHREIQANAVLSRIAQLHGSGSPEYQDLANRMATRMQVPGGTEDQLITEQQKLADIVLGSDPDILLDRLMQHVETANRRQDARADVRRDTANAKVTSDRDIHSLLGEPFTGEAIERGFDAVDPLRKGKRNSYPKRSRYPGLGLLVKFPVHLFDGKIRGVRLDISHQKAALGMYKKTRDTRDTYHDKYAIATEQDVLKNRVKCFTEATHEKWTSDKAARSAITEEFKKTGLSDALLAGVQQELETREQIKDEARELQADINTQFNNLPLGAIPTEADIRQLEASLELSAQLVDDLRLTDPLRADIYTRFIIDNVRLHQRLALSSSPSDRSGSNFNPSYDRSVIVQTSGGQATLFEDGSIETAASGRRNADRTLIAPVTRRSGAIDDQVVDLFPEEALDPDAGIDDTTLFNTALRIFDDWELTRDSRSEVLAANAIRIVIERTDLRLAGLEDKASELHAQRIGIIAQMGSSEDFDDISNRQLLSDQLIDVGSRYNQMIETVNECIKQSNATKYWQCFLGITSPIAAGLDPSSRSRMSGRGGEILIDDTNMNGRQGNWKIKPDGSSTLDEYGTLTEFAANGTEF